MTRAPNFVFASIFALVACGGQSFDVSPGGDGDVDSGVGSDAPRSDEGIDTTPLEIGPPADWTACTDVGDCELVPMTCCGTCGEPTPADVASIAKSHDADWRSGVCGSGGGPPCPGCAGRPNPNLRSTCTASHCRVLNVATDVVSACTSDADCMVRSPDCCEPCGPVAAETLVALARTELATYLAETCPAGGPTCAACVPGYPSGVSARCDVTAKHCVLVGTGP